MLSEMEHKLVIDLTPQLRLWLRSASSVISEVTADIGITYPHITSSPTMPTFSMDTLL
jgi:hypothetical protein